MLTKDQMDGVLVGVCALVLAVWFMGIVVGLPWLARHDRRACIERNIRSGQPLGVAEEVCQ